MLGLLLAVAAVATPPASVGSPKATAPPSVAGPTSPDERRRALSMRLIEASHMDLLWLGPASLSFGVRVSKLVEDDRGHTVDPQVFGYASRTALLLVLRPLENEMADLLSHQMTEDQLAASVDFYSSAAGKALGGATGGLGSVELRYALRNQMMIDALRSFKSNYCKMSSCSDEVRKRLDDEIALENAKAREQHAD
jgi:hypothetical protein